MCGIYGYIDRGAAGAPVDAERVGRTLIHRGPDDQGAFAAPGVLLGNRRLSILDIEGGHQPFVSDDGRIAVVQNGEIFNHVELARELARAGNPCRTHCDTEVLLRLYELHGIDFLDRLNGMFSFAIWDDRARRAFLVRDRVGVKPLYLHEADGRLWFASEIKALLRTGIERRIDYEALYHYLTLNYVPPPLTMFQGVRHLMPGHALEVRADGTSREWQWWDLAARELETRSEAAWIEALNATLDDAVRLRLRSDVPFGAFLSGGIDSSAVVGTMTRHADPVRTFCIGFDEARFDEARFARAAADRFGTRHVMERVSPDMLELWPLATFYCDQPHGDVSFMPTFRVAELAARHVTVVLTGDGGDELFAGYEKFRDFFTPSTAGLSTVAFRDAYYEHISLFAERAKANVLGPELRPEVRGLSSADVVAHHFERAGHLDRINQALYLDMMLLLPGNNLVKPDRMGMAVSLEARTPFLDYRLMELAFCMPGDLKLRDGETKYILKKAVSPLIGQELAYRPKQMFTVPIGEWMRGESAPTVERLLLADRVVERGLFDPVRVRAMFEAHRRGAANHTRELRALAAVEIWHRLFIDALYDSPPTLSELCETASLEPVG